MKVTRTSLPGVLIIEPTVFRDERGFFIETFQLERYRRDAGITLDFVQDNQSRSRRGVLRGIHTQRVHPQGKLVRVSGGEVFDVAVDIDPHSPHFGQWVGTTLSDANGRQMWIPPPYAHGFVTLSEYADLQFKCTDYYYPGEEIGVIWNDPELGIQWPVPDPVLAEKDTILPTLTRIRADS